MSKLTAEEQLEKFKRRHDRNMRVSEAYGMLTGITAMLRPGDFVIDCGANVGVVTEPLAATGATVHCFEPDPYAFGKLTKKFSDTPNVTLHNAAVGVKKGTVQLMRADNFDDNPNFGSVKSTVVSGGRSINEDTTIDVEQINFISYLQDMIDQHGEIAFLKMDIEGAELEILEEMETENLFDPIRCTVVETHERKFKALRPRFKALKARIAKAYPMRKVNLNWI